MTRVHAVIPAAGHGARFGSDKNKVLQELDGKTVIERTVDALQPYVDTVTVVANATDLSTLKSLFKESGARVVIGADNRQNSVWNGLQSIADDEGIVLVHDGARPLVSPAVIERCKVSAASDGSGVAALPVVDAVKRGRFSLSDKFIATEDVDREDLWSMQTPQAFDLNLLRTAHLAARESGYLGPDEASLIQRFTDSSVYLVLGERQNIKITTKEDLVFAEQLYSVNRQTEWRVGFGYDIHRLVLGRQLWLGGVLIESPLGLDGHSDADVLLHAICDSLLGAAGQLDIGHLFPNTDPAFLNISSLKLLREVYRVLQEQGWSIGNVDSMLIAEKPRISASIPQMKAAIASALQVSEERVSIKATTNEGIGSLGAGEGIACHATATIFR